MTIPVFSRPDLPTIALNHGPWRIVLFDPRADGAALGARYVHGGYIGEVYREGRRITSAPKPQWEAYHGMGCPEVFEESLGFSRAAEGEEFLRIGAGRVRKINREAPHAKAPLTNTLNWTMTSPASNVAVMETADGAVIDGKTFSYQLRRTVRLEAFGFVSETWLKVRCPTAHPLAWFPHPFFLQSSGEKTGVRLPKGAHLSAMLKQMEDGMVHLPAAGGGGVGTGVWGMRESVDVNLDPTLGGGTFRIEPSYPLDKFVCYASPCTASVEPYWSRYWHDGEDNTWSVTYRWIDEQA